MAGQAGVVVPGAPQHVTQRGNGRQQIVFRDADDPAYPRLAREAVVGVAVWAYGLTPNHPHQPRRWAAGRGRLGGTVRVPLQEWWVQ